MIIQNFYHYEDSKSLIVEFSTENDDGEYYRTIDFTYPNIFYYSPNSINEEDIDSLTDLCVIELIEQYLLENDLPEKVYL